MSIFVPDYDVETITFEHNRIVILIFFQDTRIHFKESLKDIQQGIDGLSQEQSDEFSVRQFNLKSKQGLIEILSLLEQEFCSSNSEMPGIFIHIDAHGNELDMQNDEGIITIQLTGESVSFQDLIPTFTKIFRATGGKLYLSASTCFGIGFLKLCSNSIEDGNAPFSYLVGPSMEINDQEASEFWRKFYDVIYSGDFDQSIFIDSKFHFISITELMYNAIHSFLKNFSYEKFQETMLENGKLIIDEQGAENDRYKITRAIVREYFYVDESPHISNRLDFMKIGKLIKDSDLIISSWRE